MSKKVRCSDKVGIDLDQVIAWKYFPHTPDDPSPTLKLFITGESFTIRQDEVQEPNFKSLHERLIKIFGPDVSAAPITPDFN
jgi:hypothetical protein